MMLRLKHTSFLILAILFIPFLTENASGNSAGLPFKGGIQDSLISGQLLYNGRAWRNTYAAIKGDPYLFSKEFMTGSVTLNHRTFEDNQLLYDIFKDEVMILSGKNFILQLNKELMEKFTLTRNGQVYRFVKMGQDSTSTLNGYANELYGGKSAVYVKYRKTIEVRAVDDIYDGFSQSFKVFVMKDGIPHQVKSKKQLIDLFKDNKQKITGYIRSNKLEISGKHPESFVPVAVFYDSLSR
jgi:uncharacterized protein YajQ (UPF0234 family)